MNIETAFANFPGYLLQNDPELFEVFKDSGSLGLVPDRENPEAYNLAIIMGDQYYTQEQAERLSTQWRKYTSRPN